MTHPGEYHGPGITSKLNWLRAGVLGANDGIVSVAAIVVGVAGATPATPAILAAGAAGLVGGALSMALGEYISVSSSKDTTTALIAKERQELIDSPDEELAELTELYEAKGLSPATAKKVALELTAKDALRAHLDAELNLDPDDVASPLHAAGASALAFTLGALLPLLAILLPPPDIRIAVTFVAVLVALVITGALSARVGGVRPARPIVRVVLGGALALGATFAIGTLLGTTGLV
ncbi:MAG TPA: VIT family protein [Pseudolysinimonas sp.]